MLAFIFASKYLHMEVRRDVFQAIADPTRRQIIQMLANNPLNVNAIAENFNVTRQAVSLHVKILEECGLVSIRQQGRERFCEPRLEQLTEVYTWVEQYKSFWTGQFASLEKHLNEIKSKNK